MAMQNPYSKYRDNKIFTASKEELTLMLYDGALKFCNQAIMAVEQKDFMKANDLILRVENIIREFQLTLNRDYEVSNYFAAMYEYIYRRLVEANMVKHETEKGLEILGEVKELIRDFRETWAEAIKQSKSAKPTAGTN